MDRRVVEAYWVGMPLLDALRLGHSASSLEDRYRPLEYDGRDLRFGEPRVESALRSSDGLGTWATRVSLHWDWLCDRLSARQLAMLRHYTLRQLDITNHRVEHRGAAMAVERG